MSDSVDRLRQTIAALQAQRGALGDDMVELALGPLRARLAALEGEPAAQQLRQVSVLFVDVVGSTSLSERLSPEEISAVMDGTLAGFTRLVQAHGGVVLQYAGDSMLAVFGKSVARESDAEDAVRAGLDILAQAREQAERVRQRHGHQGFGVRAGIATGGVLLGGGVDGEQSIRGMTVNLAARMEQTAPPGTLRICPDTRRLVRGLFTLHEQPPLEVKGRSEPIMSWLADGTAEHGIAHAQRGVTGVAAPMVGRAQELAALQGAWRDWHGEGPAGPMVVTVMGEAGLGKSRLLAEFRIWAQDQEPQARCLDAYASERDMGRPYGLLRQVFARQLHLLDSDAPAEARGKWLEAMTPLLRGEGDAAVLGHLLGLDFAAHDEVRPLLSEGRQLRDRAFFHAGQALRHWAARETALLLVLEDLHWADPGSLEFVDHLVQHFADVPVFLLCAARQEFDELRPAWSASAGRRRIDLSARAGADAQCLAEALLAPFDEVPTGLRERLTTGAEGNPYFMEELVNMMVDRGVIVSEHGHWTLKPERLHLAQMPSTLAGVLQARLDLLPADELHALQLAAVVGTVFWDDALRVLGLAGELPLASLTVRQLIVERPESSLEGRREFAFRHQLMHQVCYGRVLQRVKVPAHARVAQWLEALPGERPLELIAEHFERGTEPARARDAWHKAAQVAQSRYANAQALAHAQRARALTAAEDLEHLYELALLRVKVLALLAQPEPLQTALDTLEQLASRGGDAAKRAEAAGRRALFHFNRGEAATALALAEAAVVQATPDAPRQAARAGSIVGQALGRLGRHADARVRALDALALARRCGDKQIEGSILNTLGTLADDQGDITSAVEFYLQALAHHRETGNQSYEAGVLSNLGYAELCLGGYAQAQARFVQAGELFARIGQSELEAIVSVNLALVALNRGEAAAALQHARHALPLLAAAGSRWGEAAAQRVTGQAHLALGELVAARDCLHAARLQYLEVDLPNLAMEVDASLAETALAAGQLAVAMVHAEAVLAALQGGTPIDGTEEPVRVYLACWQVLDAAADQRAHAVLGDGHALLMRRAQGIADTHRRVGFLRLVPHHRRLIEAWDRHRPGAS